MPKYWTESEEAQYKKILPDAKKRYGKRAKEVASRIVNKRRGKTVKSAGSRGGNIVRYTETGKPVYGKRDVKDKKKWREDVWVDSPKKTEKASNMSGHAVTSNSGSVAQEYVETDDGKKYKVMKGSGMKVDLSKAGGVGSRGGNVIGHTRSGKPIYGPSAGHVASVHAIHDKPKGDKGAARDKANVAAEEHVLSHKRARYSKQDHADAAEHHRKLADAADDRIARDDRTRDRAEQSSWRREYDPKPGDRNKLVTESRVHNSIARFHHKYATSTARTVKVPKSKSKTKKKSEVGIAGEAGKLAMSKAYFHDEWLSQFSGTKLFDEAMKLSEEELAIDEAALQRRKPSPEKVDDGPSTYDKREALRVKKKRLALRLAKLIEKQNTTLKSQQGETNMSAYEDLFKSELGPQTDEVTDRAAKALAQLSDEQLEAAVERARILKGKANEALDGNTCPEVGGKAGARVSTATVATGVDRFNEADPGNYGKSETSKAELNNGRAAQMGTEAMKAKCPCGDKACKGCKAMHKSEENRPVVRGSEWVQWVDTGLDAQLAKSISEDALGPAGLITMPIDKNNAPKSR